MPAAAAAASAAATVAAAETEQSEVANQGGDSLEWIQQIQSIWKVCITTNQPNEGVGSISCGLGFIGTVTQ